MLFSLSCDLKYGDMNKTYYNITLFVIVILNCEDEKERCIKIMYLRHLLFHYDW